MGLTGLISIVRGILFVQLTPAPEVVRCFSVVRRAGDLAASNRRPPTMWDMTATTIMSYNDHQRQSDESRLLTLSREAAMEKSGARPQGSIAAVWRYPVKSMIGEPLNDSSVTERGLAGDRAYALIDVETGNVVSAKNPRKWGNLFEFQAAFVEPLDDTHSLPDAHHVS